MFCSIKQEFKFKSASKEQKYDSLNIKEVKLLLLRITFKRHSFSCQLIKFFHWHESI